MQKGDLLLVCYGILWVCYRKEAKGVIPIACKYRDLKYQITPEQDEVRQ